MKADFVFALENAAWPVLILNRSGVIYRANLAAADLFSAVTETGRLSAASLWSPENDSTVEVFLTRSCSSEGSPVKLRIKSGETLIFNAYVSTFTKEGQQHYLLQLLRRANPDDQRTSSGSTASPRFVARELPPETPVKSDSPTVESSLAQKQKLECALQLTRTVALDFNNALTGILGHASLVLGKMEPDHPWHASLVEIEKAAEKAAEISADLAAFSRQEKDTHSHVSGNLNELVRRTTELLQRAGSKPLTWALELEPKLFTAGFDEAKVQQAFVNILENAVQASSEGGRIIVRTRNFEPAHEIEDAGVRLPAGHYVCVEFQDTGCGIAPEVLPRIFEPFFTTKDSPRHRGLGLAWVYGVVTNHGGRVSVSSPPGDGTTVRIYLPAERKIVRDRAVPADDLNGTETILIVDDEELLLTMGEMVLTSFGYRVLTANGGQPALQLFQDNPNQIDLVITDLVMPNMSGRQLIQELRRLSPGARIICASGYSRAALGEDQEFFLQKPFTSLELLRRVRQALSDPDAS